MIIAILSSQEPHFEEGRVVLRLEGEAILAISIARNKMKIPIPVATDIQLKISDREPELQTTDAVWR